jgi:hypothetical protein
MPSFRIDPLASRFTLRNSMRHKEHRRCRDRRDSDGDDAVQAERTLAMKQDRDRNDERRHDQQSDLCGSQGVNSVGIFIPMRSEGIERRQYG